MGLRVAIQMDPLESIKPETDSTLLVGLEAQARGHELFVYTPDMLSLKDGVPVARAARSKLHANPKHHYDMGKVSVVDLRTMDVVLLRQDPPFNMSYLATTYILEKLMPGTLVANNPTHVRDQPEKLFPSLFKKFAPPTLISADIEAINDFRKIHKDIVVKPLFGHGGHGVFRIKKDDGNLSALLEMVFLNSKEPWVVQPFLPEVKDQERRIVMIDGKLSGIVGRIPTAGEIRSNFRVGGTAAKVKPTRRQREVCEALGPELKKRGILFAGVDMIGDWLTEINITSPTGMVAINRLEGTKLEAEFWDAVEKYL